MTEKQARRYLEKVRWPNGPVCPHCGNGKKAYALKGKSTRPGVYNCATCRRQFTVTIGTVMEDTHLPLRTWLMVFSLMCSAKKGISALQLQRDLNIGSYKTAWRMLKQIRKAMSNIEHGKTFEAMVEIDETYIGGKPRKSNRKHDDVTAVDVKDKNIYPPFLVYAIRLAIAKAHFKYDAKLYMKRLKTLSVEIPVDRNGKFDLDRQKIEATKYEKLLEIKRTPKEFVRKIEDKFLTVE